MAKYGKKAQEKVARSMRERKRGTLRSGSGGKVKSRKQAIAIGLSEARRAGAKVPRKKSASTKKRASSKKRGRTRKRGSTTKAARGARKPTGSRQKTRR